MATPQPDSYSAAAGVVIYAGLAAPAALPSWVPAAGSVVQIGYTSGAHPGGLPATLADISTSLQTWNPTPQNVGPWGLDATGAQAYNFEGIFNYCGGCFSTATRQWIGFGNAGHSSINIPAPFAFDLSTLAWSWLTIPVPSDSLVRVQDSSRETVSAVYPASQIDVNFAEWQGDWSGWPAGYGRPGKVFPIQGHTRCGIIYLPPDAFGNTKGAVLYVGQPTAAKSGTTSSGGMREWHHFNLDTGDWARNANARTGYGNAQGGAVYFGGSVKKVFAMTFIGGGSPQSVTDIFDPATRTWSASAATVTIQLPIEHNGFGAHIATGLLLSFCPINALGVAISTSIKLVIYAVSAAAVLAGSHTWATLTVDASASGWPLKQDGYINRIGFGYCPRNAKFYAITGVNNSKDLWVLSPPAGATTPEAGIAGTWVLTKDTLAAGIPGHGAAGQPGELFPFNKLAWDELSGCFTTPEELVTAKMRAIRPQGV